MQGELDAERSRATEAEAGLRSELDAEFLARGEGDDALHRDLLDERAERTVAVEALVSGLQLEQTERSLAVASVSARVEEVSQEAEARTTAVSGELDDEKQRREQAVAELTAVTNTLATDLGTEAATRGGAVAALHDALSVSARAQAQALAAQMAEVDLELSTAATALSTERSRATDAEAGLQGGIEAEAVVRAERDAALENDIAVERTTRAAAVETLISSILLERDERQIAVADLVVRVNELDHELDENDEDDDSLAGALEAESQSRQRADHELDAAVTALDARVTLETGVRVAEVAALTADVAANAQGLSQLSVRATTLESGLGHEQTQRVLLDETLRGLLQAEETSRQGQVDAVTALVETESAERVAAISDEAGTRQLLQASVEQSLQVIDDALAPTISLEITATSSRRVSVSSNGHVVRVVVSLVDGSEHDLSTSTVFTPPVGTVSVHVTTRLMTSERTETLSVPPPVFTPTFERDRLTLRGPPGVVVQLDDGGEFAIPSSGVAEYKFNRTGVVRVLCFNELGTLLFDHDHDILSVSLVDVDRFTTSLEFDTIKENYDVYVSRGEFEFHTPRRREGVVLSATLRQFSLGRSVDIEFSRRALSSVDLAIDGVV